MKRTERVNDPTLALLQAFQGLQSGLWTALPCKIQQVDADMTVSCLPAIQSQYTGPKGDTELMTLPVLIKCPLLFPGAGGFTLTMPVKPGDDVLVIFASRCIDSWWQNGGVQPPAELRMHDLSDGFAFPGPKALPDTFTQHADNVQLRKNDGTALIEITPAGIINITTTADVNVTAGGSAAITAAGDISVAASGTLDLTADGGMTIVAPTLNIIADTSITGALTNNGKAAGSTHYHTAQGAFANTTTPKPP